MKTQKAGEEDEDGEIKVYDDQAYIVSNGELFRFERRPDVAVNWTAIRNLQDGFQEQHNLQTSLEAQIGGGLTAQADSASQILSNLDAIAHCDFQQDRNGQHMSIEGHHTIQIAQFAMQYYLFAQKHLWNKVQTLNSYLQTQNAEADKLKRLNDRQKHKLKKQRHVSSKLNEQAIHFEVLIQKMRPDMAQKCKEAAEAGLTKRKDIRLVTQEDDRRTVKDILTEQGLLKEGEETALYDKVAYGHLGGKENQPNNGQQSEKIDKIYEELRMLAQNLARMQEQGVQVRENVEEPRRQQSPAREKQAKYSSPGASPTREVGKRRQGEAAPNGSQPLEESIRSEVPSAASKPADAGSNLETSAKIDESTSSQGGPKMRRVRNPYGSSDLSASHQSSHSVSQSFRKSKRRIEIEKVSDGDGAADDSYQDDEFEETIMSTVSNEKQRLQQQLQNEKQEKQRQKQLNRSGGKIRTGKKDATPIKEEDGEDDVSAGEEAERDARAAHVRRSRDTDHAADGFAAFERDSGRDDEIADDMLHIEEQSKSGTNSVPIEDPSGSQSGTYLPSLVEKARNLGGTDTRSPAYRGLHQVVPADESSSFNDESLLRNAKQLHAALQQPADASGKAASGTNFQNKYNSQGSNSFGKPYQTGNQGYGARMKPEAEVAEEEEEEDEDYSLNDKYSDDFDVEEEDDSASMPASQAQPANNLRQAAGAGAEHADGQPRTRPDLVDVNVSASASLLPPLPGGGKLTDQYLGSAGNMTTTSANQQRAGQKKADLKPENFALNLAESQQSIDFEFSESKTMLGGVAGFGGSGNDTGGNHLNKSKRLTGQLAGQNANKYSSKRDGADDGGFGASGSMDSHAFDLSESNFSMSRRSGTGADPRAQQRLPQSRSKIGEPAKKKEFYQFQGNKFTSYTGDNQSAGGDDDDDAFN